LTLEKDPRPADPYRQALEQVGRTTFSPGVAVFLLSAFLLTIGSLPFLEIGRALRARSAGGARAVSVAPSAAPALTASGLFERLVRWNAQLLERIHGVEDAIDNGSLLTVALRPRGQEVLTRLFDVGNEKAYCGRDGWLFYPPDVRHLTGRPFLDERVLESRRRTGRTGEGPVQPDPLPAIVRFHEQLASRGITLVVVPAPGKATVHPERFSGRFAQGRFPPVQNPSFDELKSRLSAKGVRVFDPAPVLLEAARSAGRPMFLATDTHWTPEGVRVTARALARNLVDSSILPAAPDRTGWVRRPAVVESAGDVTVLLGLADSGSPYRPESVSVERVFSEGGEPWRPDPRSEVLVLGDSFSNIYHLEAMRWGTGAGFAPQLAFELGRPVDAILQNDAGSHATRERLARDLARGEDRLAGKRVVVWEFASRELSEGDWRLVDLPEKGTVASAAGSPGRLRGRIASLLPPPRPGDAPYPDCYVPLHLVDVSWQSGGAGEKEVVAYVWALRDGRATPEAALGAGQTVTLNVVPFGRVASRVEAFRHLEFAESRLGLLPLFWAGGEESPGDRAPETRSLPPAPAVPAALSSAPVRAPEEFRQLVERRAAEAERRGEAAVEGRDGWLFLAAELRHMGTPDGADGARADRDPVDVIAGFARQLAERGVELLFMPVPPKAVVYPEELPAGEAAHAVPRLDARDERSYRALSALGVEVVDLVPLFLARRLERPLYARTDSHWSGAGVEAAASAAAASVRRRAWYPSLPRETYGTEPWSLEITGDLARLLGRPLPGREILSLSRVALGGKAVESRRGSPVLLLGDSHALVYNAGGDLLATGSGLPDHLARELGFPVDLLAVRGSGATPARAALSRRGLDGTKLVVWCLSARELTESVWRDVPLPAPPR
jgi:alginate O-acetyltransferase complex protein AlgJ